MQTKAKSRGCFIRISTVFSLDKGFKLTCKIWKGPAKDLKDLQAQIKDFKGLFNASPFQQI